MSYEAFVLDSKSRERLLRAFPPKYPDVLAHHITEKFGVPKPTEPVRHYAANVKIIGYVDDGVGCEALVVEVNEKSTRKDGKPYHITLSIDRSAGRKPADSNVVIKEKGWVKTQPMLLLAIYDVLD